MSTTIKMADVMRALEKVAGAPMMTANQCFELAKELNKPDPFEPFSSVAAPVVERQEPVAEVVSGYSGDPDSRGSKQLKILNLDSCSVGTKLYTSPPAPVAEKYDDVLAPFVALMRKELHANADKGDRPGWLSMSSDTALLEIIYHFGKLQASVKRGDEDGIREYAADVANMCMMLTDVCACLDKVKELNQ